MVTGQNECGRRVFHSKADSGVQQAVKNPPNSLATLIVRVIIVAPERARRCAVLTVIYLRVHQVRFAL